MEKYKNYLEKNFKMWQVVIGIICAVIACVAIAVQMNDPVDSSELEGHYSQLETVKQDVTSICDLENADISIDEDGMTVTLNGKYHDLKATFDNENNYVGAKIEDNRIGSNLLVSAFAVFIAFGLGITSVYALFLVLYIPLGIYTLIVYIKKKWQAKKTKQE